jgi:myo-inositol-1(or 4)-monophosphatase
LTAAFTFSIEGIKAVVIQPTLSDVENLARGAGEILRQGYSPRPGFERRFRIDYKGEIDLVTEFDHRSEDYLLSAIRQRFPGHRILSEESGVLTGGERLGEGLGEDCQWFIDPLDGTVNFAHGMPIFCVSIAYAQKGLVRLGVVYDPIRDECFSAERGAGAWLNSSPLKTTAARELIESLLVTGFPYDIRHNPENNLDHYARFVMLSQGVRRLGSAALDLCYIAAGRFDGYWEIRLNPWDTAAGGLIAAEAGAQVTRIDGSPDYLSPPYSILAANPALHAQMLEVLAGVKT